MQLHTSTRRGKVTVATAASLALVASGLVAAPAAYAAENTTEIQILAVNDFHGRLAPDLGYPDSAYPGAAHLAGALDSLRADNPNTLFASAGDNIGASTFESFSLQDNPTIDALVEMGLDVSAVGNHEFDQGLGDLVTRVLPRYSATDGGDFGLGANVYYRGTKIPRLQEFAIKEVDGIRVGFIGTVTEDTPNMVTPTGVAGLTFGDELEAVERVATKLTDGDDANGEADVIVLLTHSGFAGADCTALAADGGFGAFVRAVPATVDAIFSGHTHAGYACDVPVDGAAGVNRPVVQGLDYGKRLSQVVLTVDTDTNEVVTATGATIPLLDGLTQLYSPNTAVQAIVDDAVSESDVVGAVEIGEISADITRGGTGGSDRGVESTLGNLIADVQLWATSNESFGGVPAQVGLMNAGGLRADLMRPANGKVTYKQVATVQPFANTLVTMDLTGAQLKEILTLQWKGADAGRPKLQLGVSEGFEYYYTETGVGEGVIHQMRYQGKVVADTDVLRIVTNSFLATGGDGFTPFADGVNRADTGQVDLGATVAYFEAHDVVHPAPLGRAIAGDPPALPEEPVEKAVTSIKAVVVPSKVAAREKTNVVALVEGATSGTVEFRANGKVVKTVKVDDNGRATTTIKRKVGRWAITAHYVENDTHLGSASKAQILRVVRASSKITSAKAVKATKKRSKTFTIRVKVSPKGLAAKGKVVVRFKGKKVGTAKVNKKGIARVKVKANKLGKKKGKKKLVVRYAKSSQLKASKKVTVKVRVR